MEKETKEKACTVKICRVRYMLVSNAGLVEVGVTFRATVQTNGIMERGVTHKMLCPMGGGVKEKATGSLSLVPQPTPQ